MKIMNRSCRTASDAVVCPKPRRLPRLSHPPHDSKAGAELLDMILTQGSYGAEKANLLVPSSPPFFVGSPPSRASNPVIQDAHFGIIKPSPLTSPTSDVSPSSQLKNGGCSRVNFGQIPAAVRIEGFNCGGNCGISTLA